MRTVVLVRHGESQYNVMKRFAGWLDCDLTADGIEQARRAGQALKESGYSFDVAHASALRRAGDTLRYLLNEMSLNSIPLHRSWRLNERHYGGFDDLTRDEAELKFGAETLRRCREDFRFCPPVATTGNGRHTVNTTGTVLPRSESMHDATTRCLIYWEHVLVPQVEAGQDVLVVAHGELLRLLTGHLLGMTEDEIIGMPVFPNAVPLVLELRDDFSVSSHHFLEQVKEPIGLARLPALSSG